MYSELVKVKKYILLAVSVIFFTGCASTQVRYTETEPRQSVIKEYAVIKKMGNIFSYESKYETRFIISGKLIDTAGEPIPSKNIKLSAFGSLYDISTDEQGSYQVDESFTTYDEPNNKEVVLEISDIDEELFDRGKEEIAQMLPLRGETKTEQTVIVPLKVKYIIKFAYKKADIKKYVLMPNIKKGEGNLRDKIIQTWESQEQTGDSIQLKELTIFSEKNLKITEQEEKDAIKRAKEAEKIAKEEELEKEKYKRELPKKILKLAPKCRKVLATFRLLKYNLEYNTLSADRAEKAEEFRKYVNVEVRSHFVVFFQLIKKYSELYGSNELNDFIIKNDLRDLMIERLE
jgi:hypothetical protein